MTFWQFLDRQIGRLDIRVLLTAGLYVMAWHALNMIHGVKGFEKLEELLVQALVIQGFLGLILAFYFAANQGDAVRSENTGKFADAMKEQAKATTAAAGVAPSDEGTIRDGDQVTMEKRG